MLRPGQQVMMTQVIKTLRLHAQPFLLGPTGDGMTRTLLACTLNLALGINDKMTNTEFRWQKKLSDLRLSATGLDKCSIRFGAQDRSHLHHIMMVGSQPPTSHLKRERPLVSISYLDRVTIGRDSVTFPAS